ncbi:MAG: MlaE family lipid ABC transporter permease subunit [Hyphomicrobiaceae bacterium]
MDTVSAHLNTDLLPDHSRADAGATIRVRQQSAGSDGLFTFEGIGAWTLRTLVLLERDVDRLFSKRKPYQFPQIACLDLSMVTMLDTAGAWLLVKFLNAAAEHGCQVQLVGVKATHQLLLDEVQPLSRLEPDEDRSPGMFVRTVNTIATGLKSVFSDVVVLISFLGLYLSGLFRTLTFRSRFRFTAFVYHFENAGLRAIPIVALICFLIGAVVMQQGALQLASYGAEPYAASMLGVLALREVGILLTAVMVAGRSASAFTAEIGSMKMREEIAAMRTMGIDPVETLVIPRITALLIALPLLTFVGDMMCLAGGAVVAVFHLDQSFQTFLDRLQAAIELRHFFAGMIKSPFAALVIGVVGCSEGFKVSGSAESLGMHVTSSVVKAIFLVIILGALFSMFLVTVGI